MMFAKQLRDRVRSGEITSSIRIWQQPRVKPGGRYPLPPGHIEVESITAMEADDITPRLARESGFDSVEALLETARHGRGDQVYFIRFRYVGPAARVPMQPAQRANRTRSVKRRPQG